MDEHDATSASRYTDARNQPGELNFRYKARGMMAVHAVRSYSSEQTHLSLLDIGAADGRTLQWMGRFLDLKEGIGLEYSRSLMDQARDVREPLELIEGDATNMEDRFEDNRFDVVTALAVLEHIPEPSLAIREMSRVLKPGGLFIATCPDPLWDRISSAVLGEQAHEFEVGAEVLKGLIEDSRELDLVRFMKFMFVPLAVLPYFKILPDTDFALRIDLVIQRIRFFDFLFANQMLIARKAE